MRCALETVGGRVAGASKGSVWGGHRGGPGVASQQGQDRGRAPDGSAGVDNAGVWAGVRVLGEVG